jgi:hypothetical protein
MFPPILTVPVQYPSLNTMRILKALAPFSLLLIGFLTAPVVAKDALACVVSN